MAGDHLVWASTDFTGHSNIGYRHSDNRSNGYRQRATSVGAFGLQHEQDRGQYLWSACS